MAGYVVTCLSTPLLQTLSIPPSFSLLPAIRADQVQVLEAARHRLLQVRPLKRKQRASGRDGGLEHTKEQQIAGDVFV